MKSALLFVAGLLCVACNLQSKKQHAQSKKPQVLISVNDGLAPNYDLRHIMERDWSNIGKELEGKIHLYCGDMDNYYLNNAVYLAEEFLKSYYNGEVRYGDRAEHCWNGAPDLPNYISRLRYHTLYLDKIGKRLAATAPANFNQKDWTLKK